MKANKQEQARANIAGVMSPVQQAEMKIILAGKWPPLKPLPVFKYETDEYRAAIEFDKIRGEWVCHKTSFPSNKIQELRGGLKEITMALPHGPAEVFTEGGEAEKQEAELEKDANRRLEAIREWREKCENGARYSELRNYLSANQQEEIEESIRLTLTARQLQCNTKNVAYVFDTLSKAGGRLATLLEIAERNKAGRGAESAAQAEVAAREDERHAPVEAILPTRDRRRQTRTTPASCAHVELGDINDGVVLNISETGMAVAAADLLVAGDYLPRIRLQLPNSRQGIEISAQIVWLAESKKDAGMRFVELTADARNQISNWIASEKAGPKFPEPRENLKPALVERLIPETLENFPTKPMGTVFAKEEQISSLEPIAHTTAQVSEMVTPETPDASLPALVEALQEKVYQHIPAPGAGFGSRVRTGKVASSEDRIEDSPSHFPVLEISGFQIAVFALGLVFLVISFTVGLTMGRGPFAKRLLETQKSIPAADAASPALPSRPGETASRTPGANKLDDATSSEKKSQESTGDSEPFAKVSSRDSTSSQTMESKPSANSEDNPENNSSTRLMARNVPPPASPNPAHPRDAVDPMNGASGNFAPRGITPATRSAPHLSWPSIALVNVPPRGGKPFRVTFQEKPIAASSSFAMTSQLSVLVAPEPGSAVAHKPARLQAGELVSFVWPHYPRPGDRYGAAETVKVRTTIGKLGQVMDVKLVNGSNALGPAAMSAIRQWRYKPTLLNKRPVQAQQDVTIEFRPPQYLAHVSTQHPSHN